MLIRIGTRKSQLALIQTQIIIDQIRIYYPDISIEIIPIITSGDLIHDRPLYDIGGKALFLKEIEIELLTNNIDMGVHSLKDIPGNIPNELMIAALLEREDANDTLISKEFSSIYELPIGSSVGTCSLRRKILLQKTRPDIKVLPLRGNVDSRINQLMLGKMDAIILAKAGLKRLGKFNEYCHDISIEDMLPAPGQGIIAVEIKKDNSELLNICRQINHLSTWQLAQAERGFVEYLNATCRTPLAAHALFNHDQTIKIDLMLSDENAQNILFHSETGAIDEGKEIGIKAAQYMKQHMDFT